MTLTIPRVVPVRRTKTFTNKEKFSRLPGLPYLPRRDISPTWIVPPLDPEARLRSWRSWRDQTNSKLLLINVLIIHNRKTFLINKRGPFTSSWHPWYAFSLISIRAIVATVKFGGRITVKPRFSDREQMNFMFLNIVIHKKGLPTNRTNIEKNEFHFVVGISAVGGPREKDCSCLVHRSYFLHSCAVKQKVQS